MSVTANSESVSGPWQSTRAPFCQDGQAIKLCPRRLASRPRRPWASRSARESLRAARPSRNALCAALIARDSQGNRLPNAV
jgi:hypothetical protein